MGRSPAPYCHGPCSSLSRPQRLAAIGRFRCRPRRRGLISGYAPTEDEPHRFQDPSEPRSPIPLPPELAAFLAAADLTCIAHNSDQGALYIVKAPAFELA